MKKIFVSLFACVLFLFSCNLNMSSGDTDLIVYLPGSEGKVTQYRAENVKTYRIDLTNENGDYYSQTGERGGTIVFSNILCGTYTVDIWGLDENTFVAAHTRTTITVFKGEENYLSATAILRNKVNQFFVSVPEGVWNSDYENYFRDAKYYNAVRDVEYGVEPGDGSLAPAGDNPPDCTSAKIINPNVEYAYLNYISNDTIRENYKCGFTCKFKAEKKTRFWISIYDSLREDYGVTKYYEYDPESDAVVSAAQDGFLDLNYFRVNERQNEWKPLVRIGFPRGCGKVTVASPTIYPNPEPTYEYYDITSNTSMLPQENASVVVEDLKVGKKFIFDKSQSGGKYTAALFTGMQIDGNEFYVADITGLRVNTAVKNLNITVKSYASNEKLFISQLKNINLKKYIEGDDSTVYAFNLIIPPCIVDTSLNYEGAYIEINPEDYEGNQLEMTVDSVTYSESWLGNGINYRLLTGYRDLVDYEIKNAPVSAIGDYSIKYLTLSPKEEKNFGYSLFSSVVYNYQIKTLNPGKHIVANDNKFNAPLICPRVECSVPEFTFVKNADNTYHLKNNSDCDRIFKISDKADNLGTIELMPASKSDIESARTQTNYYADYKSISDIRKSGGQKIVKLATIDAKSFTNETTFTKLTLSNLACFPVIGFVKNKVTLDDSADYYVLIREKNGKKIDDFVVTTEIYNSGYPNYDYLNPDFNCIKQKNSKSITNSFNAEDVVVEIYLRYPESVSGDFVSVYELQAYFKAE